MKYQTIPASFTSSSVLVPVADALAYGDELLAGTDNLLLELADEIIENLPPGLSAQHQRVIVQLIHDEIDRARMTISEHTPG